MRTMNRRRAASPTVSASNPSRHTGGIRDTHTCRNDVAYPQEQMASSSDLPPRLPDEPLGAAGCAMHGLPLTTACTSCQGNASWASTEQPSEASALRRQMAAARYLRAALGRRQAHRQLPTLPGARWLAAAAADCRAPGQCAIATRSTPASVSSSAGRTYCRGASSKTRRTTAWLELLPRGREDRERQEDGTISLAHLRELRRRLPSAHCASDCAQCAVLATSSWPLLTVKM